MKDTFEDMFVRQAAFWRTDSPRYAVQDPIQVHNTLCLAIIREVTEVLDCKSWKLHRNKLEKSREALLEELIDVYKYWLCLVVHHGFNSNEIVRMFHQKSNIVEARANKEITDASR